MNVIIDLRKNQTEEPVQAISEHFGGETELLSVQGAIKPCIGCWSCWLKTPGECALRDTMDNLYPAYVNGDVVVLLMDTCQGFIDHTAKAFLDRTIPHYHPYIEIVDGECHHLARYDRYPELFFYYDAVGLTNDEDQVIEDYLWRTAYHFQSPASRIIWQGELSVQPLKRREPKRLSVPLASSEPMEKLIIYNGSPRRSGSNTAIILKYVEALLTDSVEIRDLKKTDQWDEWAQSFEKEAHVLFMMPLYVHAMPSHVMDFIERLKASEGSISFIVQSGFPESSQTYFLEAYFEQLSVRLGRKYLGTAIKGGMEGLQLRPPKGQEKMIQPIVSLIHGMSKQGKMDSDQIKALGKPAYLPKSMQVLFKVLKNTGLVNMYWDSQLKKNNCFEQRFAKPYAKRL